MNVRRSAAVLAAIAVIGTATAPAALADDASPSPSVALPSGLYGTSDPTYDGVWRQSLALLAQDTVGVKPATKAVDWLTGQQCADGGFAAYRADADKACDAKTAVDSNSTAAAVQALAALGGHDKQVGKAVTWLKSVQNEDGGWGYAPGGASDTNSTGVVVGALAAAGEKPADVKSKGGKSPYDALVRLSIPCDEDGGGAFAYQPDKKGKLAANADATAAGVLGMLGKGLVTTAGKKPEDGYICGNSDKKLTPEQAARNGAAYLADTLFVNGYLKSVLAGAEDQPDYGNTADAVVALAAEGWTKYTKKPIAWLEKNSADWAAQSGPAAYAQLVFAAHATGTDPRDFGGEDLVSLLNETGPAPQASEQKGAKDVSTQVNTGYGVYWIIGVGLVAGIGIGFLLSGRNKKQQL
ncbi:prenyltransferase/squalene oxidase repeat-containing protein [Streptomyces himalayensis]|uniref:Terpene cyclase/mutase family protein n=1 Tax=Streptomyces himalayensis subsp. himalayensis TaxID=2756131 RepID=A0A7W0DP95_9ACTN|nr:prenyltransferase/squalene oxidase repeat-containing protein [Streptomyces himalayensis]MBA2948772.1 terpene cyclase/mutase family protein [Streptomyces himalayensis subsp. himalayensis]